MVGGLYTGYHYSYGTVDPPVAPDGTANLWVDANGGTCLRNSIAVSYTGTGDTTSCSSISAAYAAAGNSGDTICVTAGSYAAQNIPTDAGKAMPATVIDGCNGGVSLASLTIGQGNGGTQPCCVTLRDMDITGSSSARAVFVYYGNSSASSRATDVTLDSLQIGVGKATNGPVVEVIGGTLRFTIKNSTIGPACCGNNAAGAETGSPVGIRIGTANRVAAGWPTNTDTVIDNNLIQGITRLCSDWLTGYGSCPQSTCTNALDRCHEDAIQIYGSTGLIVRKNRIYHTGINGIFVDSTDPNVNGTIENNMIGDIMRGATCLDIDGRNLTGTWNVVNNTCSIAGGDGFYITHAATMDTNNAVWNWKGNVGALFVSPTFTPSGCLGGTTGVFTFSYNTWSTNNSGATGCGGNETVGNPTYLNTALAPANTMDLHLSGADSFADDKIPAATCAGFVTTDIDGTTRPVETDCDAGADER
jgi:hypothetical protein